MCFAVAGAVAAVPLARAQNAALATLSAAAGASGTQNDLYLEVTLNAEATGLIMRFTPAGKGLRSSVDNLRQLGLDPQRFGLSVAEEVELDAIPGLSYEYDAARQSLALRVSDALRMPYQVSARGSQRAPAATVTPGAVLNYEAYGEFGRQRRLALFNELRYFNAEGVFSNSGTANWSPLGNQYLRFDTFWNHSNPETLESFQVGDVISSSLSWSRSVRMGGVQWRKNFQLRPDLLTFPVASVGGSALVPSSLSLYVNGIQQYSANVPSGPFVLNQVAGLNGAGQATVITRDALGRDVSTTLPLYVDTRMLAKGLSDYSVELGALRRDYGSKSFSYEKSPVASASGRHGVSDALTVEGHAELASGVYNGGAGLLWRAGQSGVFNTSLSASGGTRRGAQLGAGYQYLGQRFSIDAQTLRATPGFGDLASRDGSLTILAADRLSLNLALAGSQSLSFSYIGYRAPQTPSARIASLSYSVTLAKDLFLSLSAFQDLNAREKRGFFAGLSMAFGERMSASANLGRQSGQANSTFSLLSTPDFGGGFGWGLQSGTSGDTRYRQARLEYLGSDGRLSGMLQSAGGNNDSSLGASGALVLMDGHLAAARQVGSGFAMVSTGGIAGVPVLNENRQIGVTGGSGYMLIPNLNPYGNNQVAVSMDDLPVDARLSSSSMNVVPKMLSGVLAEFRVERYSAATIIVHGRDGKDLPSGLPVLHVESGNRTLLGYDGMIFIDDLQADNHVRIGDGDDLCEVRFSYRRSDSSGLPVIGPLTCLPLIPKEGK
ncbi:fimbrial Usher family protein [Janthinobacterium agaricidamnosum NBRC 102515 = DSM 9628]|uniref:Fimbrial Usher family protein n=1 Tax=Janthinobacterium agaricidamnosum NBRC 102515 = DSM 9628 TaxID=1349767 RepID=W0VDN4_9BURK|nr:fimbrial Usher family protein [Janthinobacterium agaricidamnosum NBRC 102515 = DSM 9628]